MHFPINLCGVEDSVENYKTFDFMLCGYGVRVIWNPFFFILSLISRSLMNFMLNYAFNHILFSLRILLLAVEMSDRQAF